MKVQMKEDCVNSLPWISLEGSEVCKQRKSCRVGIECHRKHQRHYTQDILEEKRDLAPGRCMQVGKEIRVKKTRGRRRNMSEDMVAWKTRCCPFSKCTGWVAARCSGQERISPGKGRGKSRWTWYARQRAWRLRGAVASLKRTLMWSDKNFKKMPLASVGSSGSQPGCIRTGCEVHQKQFCVHWSQTDAVLNGVLLLYVLE